MDDHRNVHASGNLNKGTEANGESRTVQVLDVEDEDGRTERLYSIFQKLDSSSSPRTHGNGTTIMPNFQFDIGARKTWAVDPPSELLSRVQAFLPQLEASNAILSQRAEADPRSVDMEHVEDDAEQYIEMNLGLGVFDMKPNGPQSGDQDTEMTDSSSSSSSASSLSSSSSSGSSSSDSDESDSDSDTDSDSSSLSDLDSEEILSSSIPLQKNFLSRSPSSSPQSVTRFSRLIRPLPKRNGSGSFGASQPKRPAPCIVVLSETNEHDRDSAMEEDSTV